MKKRVADIVFETLVENAITDCFSVVGGGAMHLNNAMALNKNINKYFNHHEQACTMAAEAYARYAGKMAAVCVTSGPGATNTLTGVMGAWEDSIPMIIISGNVRYATSVASTGLPLRYRGLQEFDIINSIKNMTKYATVVTEPLSIKSEIQKAINIAMEGRRGPVWLDIPQDIQNSIVEEDHMNICESNLDIPSVSEVKLQELFDMINLAKRPCILFGTGITCAHLQNEFEKFLDKMQIPVVGGAWYGDALYNKHPRFYGLSGNVGPRAGNFILTNADIILVLGNSLSFKQTGYDVDSFAPNSKVIMVDIDENEYLKIKNKIDVFIHTDLKEFFSKADRLKLNIKPTEEWTSYCDKLYHFFSAYEGAENTVPEERVNKYYFWKLFNEIAPDNLPIALGNSQVGLAGNQVGKEYRDQRMIANYICGSMGYDLPAAIGTAIASGRPTVCVTGDGSVMMNLQELQTIRHYNLPVKLVVFENQGYGAIKQTCNNFFDGVKIGCSPDSGVSCPDFSAVAKAFKIDYKCCNCNSEVKESLEWMFANDGPLLLEMKELLDDPVVPKLMSKLDENGNMTSPKLYDMYPFVSDDDMRWIMNPQVIED